MPFFARRITLSSAARNGASSKWRSSRCTRVRSGRRGISGAAFLEYLGEATRFLDLQLDGRDGREGEAEVLGGVQKYPCSWKFPAENFSGDTYHNSAPLGRPRRHRAVGHGRRDIAGQFAGRKLHVCLPDRSHQTILYLSPPDQEVRAAYQNTPIVASISGIARKNSASASATSALSRRAGRSSRTRRSCRGSHARWPHGIEEPARDRGVAVVLCRPGRARGSRISCATIIRYSGPGGMTEQDDMRTELRACREPRHDRAASSLHLRPRDWHRGREFRMAGATRSRPGRRHHRCALERGAGPQPLPALGRVHAGRELGRADGLAQE